MDNIQNEKTVIIADDDRFIIDDLKKYLKGSRFKVVGDAPNGLELVRACEDAHPDIVIVDIEMPVMDGIKATREIVEKNLAKCVLVLTSFDDEKYIQGAIDAGAAGYLTKPVDGSVLAPTISSAFKKSVEIYDMNKKVSNVNKRRETREIIEKAQLILMEKHGMSEADAYGYIKGASKERNQSMANVAEIIVAGSIKRTHHGE